MRWLARTARPRSILRDRPIDRSGRVRVSAVRGTIDVMTQPASPATGPASAAGAAQPAMTHPCARCGAPVPLDVGLCERCNPLGLKDAASSQVHGTVFIAVGLAVVALAVIAHIAVAGIGPFSAAVTGMRESTTAGSIVATISLTNQGTSLGTATCRLTDPVDRGINHSEVVYSPRVAPGATVVFEHDTPFGSVDRPFDIACDGP